MTIHNPIVIKCEGLNRKAGCPVRATYRPNSIAIHEARMEALAEGNWMWNIQTGDLCPECSGELLSGIPTDNSE